MAKVTFNGKEYEIDDSLIADSKTAIVDTLVALVPGMDVTVEVYSVDPSGRPLTITNGDKEWNYTTGSDDGTEIIKIDNTKPTTLLVSDTRWVELTIYNGSTEIHSASFRGNDEPTYTYTIPAGTIFTKIYFYEEG